MTRTCQAPNCDAPVKGRADKEHCGAKCRKAAQRWRDGASHKRGPRKLDMDKRSAKLSHRLVRVFEALQEGGIEEVARHFGVTEATALRYERELRELLEDYHRRMASAGM